jgi:hypothetical protein
MELHEMYPNGDPRDEPTWANQLWHARRLLREKGMGELRRHASVSRDNPHGSCNCFCCAALYVEREYAKADPHKRAAMLGRR